MKQLAPLLLVLATGVQFPEPAPAPDAQLRACIAQASRHLITDTEIDRAVLQCAARVHYTGNLEEFRP